MGTSFARRWAQTSSLVHATSGFTFTRPKRPSHSKTRAPARSGVWSRRMPVTQASRPDSSARSGSTLRASQQASGSASQGGGAAGSTAGRLVRRAWKRIP